MHPAAHCCLLRDEQQLIARGAENRAQRTRHIPRQLDRCDISSSSGHITDALGVLRSTAGATAGICCVLRTCCCWCSCRWCRVGDVVQFAGAVVAVNNAQAARCAWEVESLVWPGHSNQALAVLGPCRLAPGRIHGLNTMDLVHLPGAGVEGKQRGGLLACCVGGAGGVQCDTTHRQNRRTLSLYTRW